MRQSKKNRKQQAASPTNIVVGNGGRKRPSKRQLMLFCGVLAVIAAICVGVFFALNRQKKNETAANQPQQICSEETIVAASTVLTNDKAEELEKVTTDVLSKPQYNTDPNCLFIVLVHDLIFAKPDRARQVMNELFAISNFESAIDTRLQSGSTPRLNRESIEGSVKLLEDQVSQVGSSSANLEQQ